MQVKLPLGDVAGVVRHRMRHVAARHGGDRQDGQGAALAIVGGLLVAARHLRVQVAHVASVGRHGLHGDADFLHGIGIGGHVRQQHEHALAFFQRELLRHSQGHVRHQQSLHHRVRGQVHEHHRPREDAGVLEGTAEVVVIVEDQAQAAENDDVGVRLDTDACEELVVRLAGDREDRDLLALGEGVEDVDHRHIRADHLRGQHTPCRIDRRAAGGHLGLGGELRPSVEQVAIAAEDPAEDVGRVGGAHGMPEKLHRRRRRNTLGTGEDL